MTPEERRIKEINRRQYEIRKEKQALVNESKELTRERLQLEGYHRIERSRQAYRHKGKVKVRK